MHNLNTFFKNSSGNIATTAALLMVPMMGAVGLAVDYSMMMRERSQIQNAADSAILAGVKHTQQMLRDGSAIGKAKIDGEKTAADVFQVNAVGRGLELNGRFVPRIEIAGAAITGDSTFSGSMSTNFMGVLGFEEMPLDVASIVNISPPEFVEIHFMIDNSASMGIGATAADVDILEARSDIQCGFACHAPAGSVWPNTLPLARDANARLMLDVARDSVERILSKFDDLNLGATVTVGLHTFSNHMETLIDPTSSFADVQNILSNLEITNASGQGGTSYRHSLDQLTNKVGISGDGSSATSRRKIVVLLTDGVATNTLYSLGTVNQWGWVDDFGVDPNFDGYQLAMGNGSDIWSIGNFDPGNCSRMKNMNNVEVYAISSEYNVDQSPWDEGDRQRLQWVGSHVVPYIHSNVGGCASSSSNAFRAEDGPALERAFDDVIDSIFSDDLKLAG